MVHLNVEDEEQEQKKLEEILENEEAFNEELDRILPNEKEMSDEALDKILLESEKEKKISKKDLEKETEKYQYLKSENSVIYSRNLTTSEAEKVERILTKKALSFYYNNSFCRNQIQVEDIRSELVYGLIQKAYVKETVEVIDENGNVSLKTKRDKNGNPIFKKDENGNLIINENGIAKSVPMIAFWINNLAIDYYRTLKRINNEESSYISLDAYDRGESENEVYKKSEQTKLLASKESADDKIIFEQLKEIILRDEEGYIKYINDLNCKTLSPMKTRKKIEEIKKYIVFKAYHIAGSSDPEIYELYKKYESELTDEQKEMLAEHNAYKEKTGGDLTQDIMLKTFFDIKTGRNAGSANRIIKAIPYLISQKLQDEAPEYLEEMGMKLNLD